MADKPFPPEYFTRVDGTDDSHFYTYPRKVVHIDDNAIRQLAEQFGKLLPAGGTYLDLMSSWRSHLPTQLKPSRVAGLGMNAEEMAENPQLTEHIVHNLNNNPHLPYSDAEFDGAMCTVSVQYLMQPIKVFAEVNRVLRPGAVFIVSFSNRCFPTKAVAVWRNMSNKQHLALVTQYFEHSGNWTDIGSWYSEGEKKFFTSNDPLYIVWGHKDK